MKPFLLALLLTMGSLAANGQTPSDCQFTITFSSATPQVTPYNNRTSAGATPCVKWRVAYFADGLSAASIQLEGANDSAGVPGTWAAIAAGNVYEGTNPITDPAQGTAAMTAYFPWIRLNVTVFTPIGGAPHQIIARVYGYKGTSAIYAQPPGNYLTGLTGDVSATGPGTVAATIGTARVAPAMMKASTFDVQVDGATVTWAIASVLNAQAVLTFTVHGGSRTLNITGPVIGGNYVLKLIQDGTGGEGLILGTGCTWKVSNGGSGAVSLTNAPGAIDVIAFIYDGGNCLATFLPNLS